MRFLESIFLKRNFSECGELALAFKKGNLLPSPNRIAVGSEPGLDQPALRNFAASRCTS